MTGTALTSWNDAPARRSNQPTLTILKRPWPSVARVGA